LYGSKLIRIPAPRFVVFYNGAVYQPEKQILKLSDAYEKRQESPELELSVTVYNINRGNNEELMDACQTLKEYALYVEQVRMYAKQRPLAEAVEQAVDYCIEAGILAEFLRKNRAEAIKVSIYEYDEELHFRTLKEEGREEGLLQGEHRLNLLYSILIDTDRLDDLKRATKDKTYREQLMKELLPEELLSLQ
ncbi:MAG: hypothetical protein J1F41_02955, partial [Lachnospiraceae bacterium]|nr:hypothetical protein [Lachnospiraceae bacterium]